MHHEKERYGALFSWKEVCQMVWTARFRSALRAALWHLAFCALVATTVAWVVFVVWFPSPLHELTGGRNLFLILMAVDLVCGPMLTLVLYDPAKSRLKWRVDLALIVLLQLGALVYGIGQVAAARPVFVAFEGDRFRVVQAFDVDMQRLPEARDGMQSLPLLGPKLIGVRLAHPGDADYLASVQMSTQGLHPSFRPSRWIPWGEQLPSLQAELQPLSVLRERHREDGATIDAVLAEAGLLDSQMGYLPLVREEITDWVAIVERASGQPRAYLHLDGWR
ncbi:MAG: TfpX/TfpZ family type IV pilin accessory protein [Hydrogenophaga sp.]|uniref:TfpX/TfpZ family type IV pilin accessory protein n=1 Tax=Hydrogenophaga sp. TaxID=1904254 RepID=UPI001DE4AA5A|nr:hypothetical protein [Hydrogenophaga sp.]